MDLFTPQAGGPGRVIEAIQTAQTGDGFQVRLLRATQDGDFAELQVSRHGQITQLDLGRDWRAHQAVTLDIGPVLHLDDAVGSKTTALLGRALPRDYIDIAAALSRYPRRQLLELAFDRDRVCGWSTSLSPPNGWIGSTMSCSCRICGSSARSPTSVRSSRTGHATPPTTQRPRPPTTPRTARTGPQSSRPLLPIRSRSTRRSSTNPDRPHHRPAHRHRRRGRSCEAPLLVTDGEATVPACCLARQRAGKTIASCSPVRLTRRVTPCHGQRWGQDRRAGA